MFFFNYMPMFTNDGQCSNECIPLLLTCSYWNVSWLFFKGPSWWWWYDSCEFERRLWRVVLDTTLCDKVCLWLTTSRWFSPGTSVSSTNKSDRHDITEILLKVALNTIIPNLGCFINRPNLFNSKWLAIENTHRTWQICGKYIDICQLVCSYISIDIIPSESIVLCPEMLSWLQKFNG